MTKNTLTTAIESYQSEIQDTPRDYIGASIIGSDCLRQIWYELNGFVGESIPPKLRRTFEIGKKLEGLILEWVEKSGKKLDRTPIDLQAKDIPYFKGHTDAIWVKDNEAFAVVEIKTSNNSNYNVYEKKGLRAWSTQYYAQTQSYIGKYRETTLNELNSAYILVLNKDNSDLSDELVQFDESFYESLKYKARMIYEYKSEPPRVNNSPAYFKCKMCKFRRTCHK